MRSIYKIIKSAFVALVMTVVFASAPEALSRMRPRSSVFL